MQDFVPANARLVRWDNTFGARPKVALVRYGLMAAWIELVAQSVALWGLGAAREWRREHLGAACTKQFRCYNPWAHRARSAMARLVACVPAREFLEALATTHMHTRHPQSRQAMRATQLLALMLPASQLGLAHFATLEGLSAEDFLLRRTATTLF